MRLLPPGRELASAEISVHQLRGLNGAGIECNLQSTISANNDKKVGSVFVQATFESRHELERSRRVNCAHSKISAHLASELGA